MREQDVVTETGEETRAKLEELKYLEPQDPVSRQPVGKHSCILRNNAPYP